MARLFIRVTPCSYRASGESRQQARDSKAFGRPSCERRYVPGMQAARAIGELMFSDVQMIVTMMDFNTETVKIVVVKKVTLLENFDFGILRFIPIGQVLLRCRRQSKSLVLASENDHSHRPLLPLIASV